MPRQPFVLHEVALEFVKDELVGLENRVMNKLLLLFVRKSSSSSDGFLGRLCSDERWHPAQSLAG